MSKQPIVSVFMPVYNQEDLVAESIESVIDQSFTDWELVIGDDCSTDNTYEVARGYQERFPEKIRLFRNQKNLGITGNCNKLLKHCNGKFVAFTAGDDLFLPGKLEKQVALMDSRSDCVLSYHDIAVFDNETGETIRFWNTGEGASNPVVGKAKNVAKELVSHGTAFMAALSIMVRRRAIPSSGYDERVPIASDWLLWIDICANSDGTVEFIPNVLARYRKHPQSITYSTRNDVTDQMVTLGLVEARYFWLRDMARRRRGYEFYRQGVSCILNGDPVTGRNQLWVGIKTCLWSWKSLGWWLFSWFKQVSSKL
ncbi:MAG: glycosyltransferase [Alloalcanivorax venustensis]